MIIWRFAGDFTSLIYGMYEEDAWFANWLLFGFILSVIAGVGRISKSFIQNIIGMTSGAILVIIDLISVVKEIIEMIDLGAGWVPYVTILLFAHLYLVIRWVNETKREL